MFLLIWQNILTIYRNTVRTLQDKFEIDSKTVDAPTINEKFPFLIKVNSPVPIELAQTVNLRSFNPIVSATENKFVIRPREIKVDKNNLEQLNKHSELFERVEKIYVKTDRFNYDCLPGGIKEINFGSFEISGEKLESLVKNSWKFENSFVDASFFDDRSLRKILNSFKKVKKVKVDSYSEVNLEEFSQFRFVLK